MALALVVLLVTATMAQVPCRYVPNGSNVTLACDNGYWQTTTPDGEVITGHGVGDPNADAAGSNIVINPATSWPTGQVTAPPQQLPLLAPGQANQFGYQPRD